MRKVFLLLTAGFLVFGLWYVQAQEKGQPHLLDLAQKKHDAGISQRPHDSALVQPEKVEEKRPMARPPERISRPAPPTQKDRLSQGWRSYRKGDYARAISLFTQASTSSHGPTALEARLGLAYSYLKQGRQQRARELLEELAKKGYQVDETLPNLLPLLLAEEDYALAKPYIALLPEDQRAGWQKRFREAEIRKDYRKMVKPAASGELNQFVRVHEEGLGSCIAEDVFARVARELGEAGAKPEAESLYRKLLKCPERDWKMRLGIVYGLAELTPPREMESLIQGERGKGPRDYEGELDSLELVILRKQLPALPAFSPEIERVAERILTLRPEDSPAQRALAWMYFNQGREGEAYRLFSSLHAQYPAERDYALGLVYSQMRMGRDGEALALAEKVGFRDEEWQRVRNQLYLKKAREAYEKKDYTQAESYLGKALAIQPDDRDAQILLGWVLFSQGQNEKALSLIRAERGKGRLSAEQGSKLNELELALLRKQLAAWPPSSPAVEQVAKMILAIQPEDPPAQRALAWMYYRQGKEGEAYQLFSSLHSRFPGERDYALGLVYTQMRVGKTDEALALAERATFKDEEWERIRAQLFLKKGGEAYDQKKYPEAQAYAGKTLSLQPDNRDAQLLSARIHSARGRPKEALPIYLDLYQKSPSPELGQSILSAYEQTGERRKAFQFAGSLGKEVSPESKKAAAKFFYKHDAPVRAGQTNPEPGTCYYNADKPSLDLSFLYRDKTGTSGLDRLREAALPLTLDYPTRYGKKWTFSLVPTYLSSGSAPSLPYAGSYHKYANGGPQMNDLFSSLWVWKPEIGFQEEGPFRYGFLLGTSFINGPVSPLPTFTAGMSGKNWLVNLHQLQVDESILSYAGQRDPYSDRNWGRVLRTGIGGEITLEPRPYYWLTFSGGYDYLWGSDVWSNQGLWGNASLGKTIPWGPGDLSLGWFAAARHFQRNTNFFTFGHGGYFSPEIFFMSGPTLRFKTTPCSTYSIDGRVSAGYLYYQTKDSPHYPLFQEDLSTLNASARNDAAGIYGGENVSKLGISGKIRAVKLFGRHWIGSAFIGFNNASSYTEWRGGISLQYFFDPLSNAGEFRHFLLREPEDRYQGFYR